MEIFRRRLPRHCVNYRYYYYSISVNPGETTDCSIIIVLQYYYTPYGGVVCAPCHVITTHCPPPVLTDVYFCIAGGMTNKNINKNREKHY